MKLAVETAKSAGVPVAAVYAATFAFGTALAGLAGILLAPITGKLIADLITDGRSSISLEPFRPDRPFPSVFRGTF